ncbi:hypothetical protein [Actinomadura alba]|uniref:DUF6199 domain-containing protein n=1 Tax=Actinomadura alba TaxID=406431 RepID=A0ABR7LY45_9ACTN|nr:hypothetical protein [Actinomadura alba]MBC6469390.1 hypothetical protein [Actinomadura alba]
MTGWVVLLFILAGVFILLGLVDQRKFWWMTTAWQYRNPEANEPSDSSLALGRFSMFAMAVMSIIAAVLVMDAQRSMDEQKNRRPTTGVSFPSFLSTTPTPDADKAKTYSRSEVRKKAEAVAAKLVGELVFNVRPIITTESDDNLRHKERKGKDKYTKDGWEYTEYELTNRKGKYPVCLTVREPGPLHDGRWRIDSAKVRNGRC